VQSEGVGLDCSIGLIKSNDLLFWQQSIGRWRVIEEEGQDGGLCLAEQAGRDTTERKREAEVDERVDNDSVNEANVCSRQMDRRTMEEEQLSTVDCLPRIHSESFT
jgi:hypothetical protein